MHRNAQTGAQAQHGAQIGGNIGFEQGQTHGPGNGSQIFLNQAVFRASSPCGNLSHAGGGLLDTGHG